MEVNGTQEFACVYKLATWRPKTPLFAELLAELGLSTAEPSLEPLLEVNKVIVPTHRARAESAIEKNSTHFNTKIFDGHPIDDRDGEWLVSPCVPRPTGFPNTPAGRCGVMLYHTWSAIH